MSQNTRRFVKQIVLYLFIGFGLFACQPKERMITVGVVNFSKALEPTLDGFQARMTELGYIEGENITYLYDGPGRTQEELNQIAVQFVEAKVDLILSISTPASQAARDATVENKIPVIFAPVTNPESAGLVSSLSQPGDNMTGVTNLSAENLRLAWLIKINPDIKKVYIVYNSNDASANNALETALKAAQELNVELILREATNSEQIHTALNEIPEDIHAIFMLPDGLAISNIEAFVKTAIERQLPLCGPTTTQVKDGALISYGLDVYSAGEQAARLADQILNGIDPAVLPVEEAKFFLAINLQTADLIGLNIPDEILNQADIIER